MPPLDQALAVRAPSDLGEGASLSFDCHAKLRWKASARFTLDYYWFHETGAGTLDADFGERTETATCPEVTFEWTGSLRMSVTLDERGRLRLLYELAGRESPGVLRVRARPPVLTGEGRPSRFSTRSWAYQTPRNSLMKA